MNKITVIHHSADFDGLFCREIARKFLPGAELIGWDFGQAPIPVPEAQIYILDLPVDRVFGDAFSGQHTTKWFVPPEVLQRIVWIDHHKSSIESHPATIPGYRIDGVAACRLAWQWFTRPAIDDGASPRLPAKQEFIDRVLSEPRAVRLAGEYDVWDKRDPEAEVFQFGLRSFELSPELWAQLLRAPDDGFAEGLVGTLLNRGELLQRYQQRADAAVMEHRSFLVEFEGLTFLALNTARCNSLTFAARDVPATGHDALLGICFDGSAWKFSLYHARHRTELDLSVIATKFGGGGHRGACGFQAGTWQIAGGEMIFP